jgi:hypothetical protein
MYSVGVSWRGEVVADWRGIILIEEYSGEVLLVEGSVVVLFWMLFWAPVSELGGELLSLRSKGGMVSDDVLALWSFLDVPGAGWVGKFLPWVSERLMFWSEGVLEFRWELEVWSGGWGLVVEVREEELRLEGKLMSASLWLRGCTVGIADLNVSGVKLGWSLGHWYARWTVDLQREHEVGRFLNSTSCQIIRYL